MWPVVSALGYSMFGEGLPTKGLVAKKKKRFWHLKVISVQQSLSDSLVSILWSKRHKEQQKSNKKWKCKMIGHWVGFKRLNCLFNRIKKSVKVWCLLADLSQPALERSLPSLRFFTVFLFEELVFSSRSPLLTSGSTNSVLWEEDEDAVKSTELWGQDKKLL